MVMTTPKSAEFINLASISAYLRWSLSTFVLISQEFFNKNM